MNDDDQILDGRKLRDITISLYKLDHGPLMIMHVDMKVDEVIFRHRQYINSDDFAASFDHIFESLRRSIKRYINAEIPLPGPLFTPGDRMREP